MTEDRSQKYGRLLSPEEYDRQISRVHDRALAEVGPSASRAELDRRVRRLEVDLAIDRRLGVDFPPEKRAELLEIRERVDKQRRRLVFRMIGRAISRRNFADEMQGLVKSMVHELSSGLTEDELSRFLGIRDASEAALPLDPDQIDPEAGGSA